MHAGHRHQSLRRRGLLTTAGRSKRLLRFVDVLAYVVSILSLLFTFDQVRIIWVEQNASGVSFLSWVFYTLSAVVWFFYGLVHRDRVLIITNAIWVIFSLFIATGIVIYS